MKKPLIKLNILLLMLVLLLQVSACSIFDHSREKPRAVNGTIELVKWDLNNQELNPIGASKIFIHAAYIEEIKESANLNGQRITKSSPGIKTSLEMMLMGCLLVMGIYNLLLFLFFRKEATYASFGVLCLLACVRIATNFQMYIVQLIPGVDIETVKKIEFITYALFVPLCVTYIRSLFAEEFKNTVVKVMWAAGIISSALILITPYFIYIRIIRFFDLLTIAICVYTFVMVVRAAMNKRNGSYIMLTGMVIVCLGVFSDILYKLGIVSNGGMASYGLSVFLLLQIYLISFRFIDSYKKEIISIHDLKKISIDLERSKNLLNCIFDSLSSSLLVVDDSKVITGMNVPARKCLPEAGTEIKGKRLWEIIPLREEYKGTLENVIKTGNTTNLRNEQIIKDDNRLFNISISPFINSSSAGAVILANDVTEINRKEEQIKQTQKMETIGILAGGLAHDFNNALGGILSTATLMKYCITEGIEDNRVSERISLIERAAKNAADLVGRFLNLTKRHDISFVPVDLNNTVQHVVKICRDTFDKSLEIHTSYLMEDAFVLADELQVEHALLNLCINASQAMTMMRGRNEIPGGVLDIAIGSIDAGDNFFKTHEDIRPQDFWTVSVTDTGVGMDSDSLGRIFEPFFSTKETGTGLGLVMTESIVKQHGGFIDVRSLKGKGSVFMICFKKYTGALAVPAAAKTTVNFEKDGEGFILLAEDDTIIRDMAKELLEENGYNVIEAKNGEEALNIFRQRSFEIYGVFMDTAMPVMSGRDAFVAMKEIDPDVKVLLTSGFAHDPVVKDAIAKGVTAFLRKPYSMHELLSKIKEVFG